MFGIRMGFGGGDVGDWDLLGQTVSVELIKFSSTCFEEP
jgi:hypothetical protein